MADRLLAELIQELPAVLIVGPRASGKTTTAARHASTVVHLDDPTQAEAFRADPDTALSRFAEPVLLDEWQATPTVLAAVKRAVDRDFRPGRFIITGSVRADLDVDGWPGTGRLVRVRMTGLSERELRGATEGTPTFLRTIATSGIEEVAAPSDPPNLYDYLELAVRGGFPEPALTPSSSARARLLDGYVDQLITRDLAELIGKRDPDRVRTYFEALAVNTAGVVSDKTLHEAAGIDRKTAVSYQGLLRDLFVFDELPAWNSNRLKRMTRMPKRYITDSGLVAALLGVDADGILREGDLIGRLLDTFVVAQLRAELDVGPRRARLFHLRQEKGAHEVDIVVEFPMNRVVGIEVKASSAPRRDSGKHLAWLRDQIGDKFIGGIVLHTGPHAYPLADKIIAAPIAALWA
ncbi:MAG: ATP-binding protein [Pseudonocardiaceae bacterium]